MNLTNPNFNKFPKSLQNEELFFLTIFQILLGEHFESLIKRYDQNIFKSINDVNDEIVKKIKEHNTMIIYSIFKNVEN